MENKEKKYVLNIYNTLTGCVEPVEVSEEVYKEYKRSYWRERKNNRKHAYYTIPFSALTVEDDDTDASECYGEFEDGELPIDLQVSLSDEWQRILSVVNPIVRRRMILHYIHSYTIEEIADMEEVSPQAIKNCFSEAKKKIKKIF